MNTQAEAPAFQEPTPTISLHALTGLWRIRATETMQIKVTMGAKTFIALLDTGSTHNFISEELVPHMGVKLHRPYLGLRGLPFFDASLKRVILH